MTAEFDQKITSLQDTKRRNEEAIAKHKANFLNAAGEWLKEWFWSTAEKEAKLNADVTNALGVEKIGQLKQKVRDLQARSAALITQHVDVDEVWHYYRNPDAERSSSINIVPDVKAAMSYAMGELRPILVEFGYIKNKDAWGGEQQRPRYPIGFDLSRELAEMIKTVEACASAWLNANNQIQLVEIQKTNHQAANLWEQA